MQMHGGLELARPKRRKLRWWWLVLLGMAVFLGALPRLAAALPAGISRADEALAGFFVPQYTRRLTALQQQNAELHSRLAQAETALAENEALRSLLGCERVQGSWQPARVVRCLPQGVTLACRGAMGAAVLDPQGRWAGRVTAVYEDGTRFATLAGQAEDAEAGLAGNCAGLLDIRDGWVLTSLPADSGLAAGTVVTTPEGLWLGTLAEAPTPAADGLTAAAPLTDTADLGSTVFFVEN